jgi:Paf1
MEVAILEPKEVPEFGTEYVFSAFLPQSTSIPEIKDHLSSSTETTSPPFSYSHIRDYEGNLINPTGVKHDYAIYFLNERKGNQRRGAYYLPISGKSNLKRRRTTRTYGSNDRIDGIELTLRAQTSEEVEMFDREKREFEEGGVKREIESPQDDDDGLSDTDAIGEEDPLYTSQ